MRIDRASNQRIERRREAWRAGGCVGPEPGEYRAPEREDWEGGASAAAAAEEASAAEEAAAAEATDSGPRCLGRVGQAARFEVIAGGGPLGPEGRPPPMHAVTRSS